jgi:hypothetical protein
MKPVLVEFFEHQYGVEEKRFFGLFTSMKAWFEYCHEHEITASFIDDNIGSRYSFYSDVHSYSAKEVDFIK